MSRASRLFFNSLLILAKLNAFIAIAMTLHPATGPACSTCVCLSVQTDIG